MNLVIVQACTKISYIYLQRFSVIQVCPKRSCSVVTEPTNQLPLNIFGILHTSSKDSGLSIEMFLQIQAHNCDDSLKYEDVFVYNEKERAAFITVHVHFFKKAVKKYFTHIYPVFSVRQRFGYGRCVLNASSSIICVL